MKIKLKEIEIKEKIKLENLIQLYLHDLCNWFKLDFNSEKCLYDYDLESYFKTIKVTLYYLKTK